MSFTLALTGMDQDTAVAMKVAFDEANERLEQRWQLVPEAEADHIVVDMDSMYGPMSWLRLHAAGKTVIGMTSAERTQTEFKLSRPFDDHQVFTLLTEIEQRDQAPASNDGTPASDSDARDEATPDTDSATEVEAEGDVETPDSPPRPETNAPLGTVVESGSDNLPQTDGAEAVENPVESTPPLPDPVPEPAPIAPEVPARDPVFADWMRPGPLPGRVRYRRGDGPTLFIDPAAQTWHGPTALKAVAPVIEGTVDRDAFEPVENDLWASQSAAAGDPQPLSRLAWLGGLVAGQGALLPEHDAEGRYALTKWPQTEREYPQHFRIATAMMKGTFTVDEIAKASAIPVADVADFINANLVTGFAQYVPEPPAEPVEPPKQSGFLGRLRRR